MPSFSQIIGSATDPDTTSDQIKKTTLTGPLAVSLSEALNEAYSIMPNVDTANTAAIESQQISSVQKTRLIQSLPKDFASRSLTGATHTTIYAVRRSEVRPEDVTQIFNRLANITTQGGFSDGTNKKPLVILFDISTDGDVSRKDLGVTEGMALAVEAMAKKCGVPVVATPIEALMVNVTKR